MGKEEKVEETLVAGSHSAQVLCSNYNVAQKDGQDDSADKEKDGHVTSGGNVGAREQSAILE